MTMNDSNVGLYMEVDLSVSLLIVVYNSCSMRTTLSRISLARNRAFRTKSLRSGQSYGRDDISI